MKAVTTLAFFVSLLCAVVAPVQVVLALPAGVVGPGSGGISTAEAATGADVGHATKGSVVTNRTVFFGCVTGGSLGALAMMLPPIAGWTIWAGSLPSVIAFATSIGAGCAIGMFGAAFISTLAWILQGLADFFSGRW